MEVSSKIREGLNMIASALNMSLREVLQLYASFSPSRARLVDVVERDGEVVAVRMVVESGSRRGERHYVAVGYGAWKCDCEAAARGRLCRHAKLAIVTWEVLNVAKYGRHIDLNRVAWLQRTASETQSPSSQ